MPAPILWNRKPLHQNLLALLPPSAIRPQGWLLQSVDTAAPVALPARLMRKLLLEGSPQAEEAAVAAILEGDETPDDSQIQALMLYHAETADRRAAEYLLGHARRLHDRLQGGDMLPVRQANNIATLLRMALWLYNLTGNKALLELSRLLKAQAPDWMSTFHAFAQTKAAADLDPSTHAYWRAHGPTLAASLQVPALQALFEGGLKNETAFTIGWEKLMRYHGAGHGLFNADPMLAGANPSQPTDIAVGLSVMDACRTVLAAQATPLAGDLLEEAALGVLTAGYCRQAANQLSVSGGEKKEGAVQYAASLWMATRDEGLAAIGYAPCEIRWRLLDTPVRIQVRTRYPYEESIHIHVRTKKPVQFPLRLRIPAWAKDVQIAIGGEILSLEASDGFILLDRLWHENEIRLILPMPVYMRKGFHQSISVWRGPLAYALPVCEDRSWQVALVPSLAFEQGEAGGIPIVKAAAAPLPGWAMDTKGSPLPPPILPRVQMDDVGEVTLIPYAQQGAHITQFPAAVIEYKEDTIQ